MSDYPEYIPSRSAGSTDLVATFCREAMLSGDVSTVPGVGKKTFKDVLTDAGIVTVGQLVARFIANIDGERSSMDVCQAFSNELKDIVRGTAASRTNTHTVVFAISNFLAEKGMFDYQMDSDDDR